MLRKLIDIANVRTGQTFRGKVENNPNGNVWVVQMKDLNDTYTGLSGIPHYITKDEFKQYQLLQKGDILIASKGMHNKAFLCDLDNAAIASSAFFVITPNKEKVEPTYLAWFINQSKAQNHFEANRAGQTVPSLKIGVLEELRIDLPSLKEQKLIGEIHELSLKEEGLINELLENKKRLITGLLKTI